MKLKSCVTPPIEAVAGTGWGSGSPTSALVALNSIAPMPAQPPATVSMSEPDGQALKTICARSFSQSSSAASVPPPVSSASRIVVDPVGALARTEAALAVDVLAR